MSFRIKAPIFLARQLAKHQVGLSWNEESRRYVENDPEFFDPQGWRARPKGGIKQGSSDECVDYTGMLYQVTDVHHDLRPTTTSIGYTELCETSLSLYKDMLCHGIAPEMARMALPLSTMTEWVWSGSLVAFARVCKLRLDPHAQRENLQVAGPISEAAAGIFPVSWEALLENA